MSRNEFTWSKRTNETFDFECRATLQQRKANEVTFSVKPQRPSCLNARTFKNVRTDLERGVKPHENSINLRVHKWPTLNHTKKKHALEALRDSLKANRNIRKEFLLSFSSLSFSCQFLFFSPNASHAGDALSLCEHEKTPRALAHRNKFATITPSVWSASKSEAKLTMKTITIRLNKQLIKREKIRTCAVPKR